MKLNKKQTESLIAVLVAVKQLGHSGRDAVPLSIWQKVYDLLEELPICCAGPMGLVDRRNMHYVCKYCQKDKFL